MGAGHDAQQRPERVAADARPIIGHRLEVLAERAQLWRVLEGPRRRPRFDRRQGGPQMLGLQTAAGVPTELACKEPLGPVMAHIEIARVAATAIRGAEFAPA